MKLWSLCRGKSPPRFLAPSQSLSSPTITSSNQKLTDLPSPKPRDRLSLTSTFLRRRSSPAVMFPPRRISGVAGLPKMSTRGGTVFKLSESSVLKIFKGDIIEWSIDGSSDAIVNPANERMLGGGGADGAIHRAAGPQLLAACYEVPEVRPGIRCPTGEARITQGFNLPASHVIHTVGPIYYSDCNPQASLRNAYRNSLKVARENNIHYIAFPAISCGIYGYPFDEAAAVAISTVKEFANDLKEVHFVLFTDDIYSVWLNKAKDLLQA